MNKDVQKEFEKMFADWERLGWITVNPAFRRDALAIYIRDLIRNLPMRAFFEFIHDILP